MKKVIIAFGWFDGPGEDHRPFLEQAKRYGDRLVAIIATNKSIKKYAGVKPDFSASIRFQQIKELNIVDELIMSTSADYFKAVTHYKPHAVAIKTWSNKILYDLSETLFENRITTKVITIDWKQEMIG